MPHSLVLLAACVLTFFWLFSVLADYGWETRKRRTLVTPARLGALRKPSERREYAWYAWIRYLMTILIAYVNAMGLIGSEPQRAATVLSPFRTLCAISAVILFSIALLAIDGYWDRSRQGPPTAIRAWIFWFYFWLRYPALILATFEATSRTWQP